MVRGKRGSRGGFASSCSSRRSLVDRDREGVNDIHKQMRNVRKRGQTRGREKKTATTKRKRRRRLHRGDYFISYFSLQAIKHSFPVPLPSTPYCCGFGGVPGDSDSCTPFPIPFPLPFPLPFP